MKWIALIATTSLLAASAAAEEKSKSGAASKAVTAEPTIHVAENLQWGDAPPRLPAGGKLTVLDGDPGARGPFIARLKMPAGYKIMPHTHPAAERVTVISGTLHIATGDKLDEGAGRKLNAGDFVVFPKGSKHSAWVTEESVIQIQSEGPFDMSYVDRAHDPRQKK